MHFFTGLPNKTISPIRQLELIQIAAAWILHNTWKTEYISSSHNHITSSNSRILAVVFSSIHNGFEGRAYSQGSGPKIYCVVQAGQASLVCTHRSGGGGGCPKLKPNIVKRLLALLFLLLSADEFYVALTYFITLILKLPELFYNFSLFNFNCLFVH